MARLRLVHWKEAEGRERARALRAAGFRVDYDEDAPAALSGAKDDPPDAFVIDLTRLPSHGREMAWALRQAKKTRAVPLVFLDGEPAKVARLRKELPDATFAEWDGAARAIERALATPVRDPVVPERKHFYTAKPLGAKLGLKEGMTLALVDAPQGFEAKLGDLPTGVRLRRGTRKAPDLYLWFVASEKALRAALPKWRAAAEAGARIWAAWPKKGSPLATELSGETVRTAPHAHGLVDFKICALDDDWSGMCFALRRAER
jgi:hypothetical protein